MVEMDKEKEIESHEQAEKPRSRQVSVASLCVPEREPRARRPNFSNPSEIVTLYVGKKSKAESFIVHKEFACFYSPVLKAAFNGEYLESQTQSYWLEDFGANTCRLLVQWLYTQRFDVGYARDKPCITSNESSRPGAQILSKESPETESSYKEELEQEFKHDEASQDDTDHTASFEDARSTQSEDKSKDDDSNQRELELIKLWVLADTLLIRPLQNVIVEVLEAIWADPRYDEPAWSNFMPYIYANTADDSALRHLFLDKIAYDWGSSEILQHYADCLPKELLLDLFSIFSAAIYADTQTNSRGQISKAVDKDGKQKYVCKRVWRSYFVCEDDMT